MTIILPMVVEMQVLVQDQEFQLVVVAVAVVAIAAVVAVAAVVAAVE